MISTSNITKYWNIYMSLLLYIKRNQNILMLIDNNYVLDYSIYYNKEKYLLYNKKQNSRKD